MYKDIVTQQAFLSKISNRCGSLLWYISIVPHGWKKPVTGNGKELIFHSDTVPSNK